jgi:hypothetical protein
MPMPLLWLVPWLATAVPVPSEAPPGSAAWERPGETLDYDVDLGPLSSAAWVRIETLEPTEAGDPSHRRLLAEVGPGSVMRALLDFHYRLLSNERVPGMLPDEATRQVREGGSQTFAALRFDRAAGVVRESATAGGETVRADPVGPDTRDLLGALFYLRSLPAAAAGRWTVFEDRRLYRVDARPVATEEIEIPAGRFPARRYRLDVEPAAGERPVREVDLWLSEDGARLPLKLQAQTSLGLVVATLRRAGCAPSGAPR